MEKLIITPRTKIADLLEAYPELEETLIDQAPQFKKLRNPLLRKTIARVTTLSQAAAVGSIKVEALVNALRREAGQTGAEDLAHAETDYMTRQPDWHCEPRISKTLDVRDTLNRGEHPVHEVLAAIRQLPEEGILKIIAPFLPAPLIDKAVGLEYRYWVDQRSAEEFHVYFMK